MSDDKTVNYGIWLPGSGWVRGNANEALAFENKDVADYYAAWFRGKSMPVDQSLIDLQDELLQSRKRQVIMAYLQRN